LVHSNAFLDKTKIWIGPIDKQRERKEKKKKKKKTFETRQRSTEHAITYCWLADTTDLHKSYKAMEKSDEQRKKKKKRG